MELLKLIGRKFPGKLRLSEGREEILRICFLKLLLKPMNTPEDLFQGTQTILNGSKRKFSYEMQFEGLHYSGIVRPMHLMTSFTDTSGSMVKPMDLTIFGFRLEELHILTLILSAQCTLTITESLETKYLPLNFYLHIYLTMEIE
ncbi:unnamed protein product [Allacma fusca]|uniref:Uncharacterized protein n=1 Tax=Allacma fusca TaxID=39272 RepID=A0A8J2J338_9HEXA|nr:unnamed protein product [Allacma fusca]